MSNGPPKIQLQDALKPSVPDARPWTPELFEEITDLMAEALFLDFQAHRKRTV